MQESRELPPDEMIHEFMATFHKLMSFYGGHEFASRVQTGDKCDPYKPVKCPGSGGGGGLPAMCKAINEWAACWKAWGDEVHKKLFPSPDDPPPPPPPPFLG